MRHLIAALILLPGCRTYFTTQIPHQKDRAWAAERTAFLGLTVSEKVYYCYAEERKAQPVCIEAEFVSKPEE